MMPDFRSLFAAPEAAASPDFSSVFAPAPSTSSDLLQSLPQYGVTAASSALGLPGDIVKGFQWLGRNTLQHQNPADYAPVEGSTEVARDIGKMTGPLYQPQTPIGKGANVAAGLLPAVVGGPEGIATKLATRVAAPAAAVTGIENSPLPDAAKPWAEGATLLLSPFAASKAVGATLKTVSSGALPTTTQIKSTRDAIYKMGDLTGTTVNAPVFKQWATQALTPFVQKYATLNEMQHADAGAYSLVKRISDQAGNGLSPTLQQIKNWRYTAGKLMDRPDDQNAAHLYGQIQGLFKSLTPTDLNGPDKSIALQAMAAGDEMHSRYKNSQLLDQYAQQSMNRAGKNYTQAGIGTAQRQKFGELANRVAVPGSKESRFIPPDAQVELNKLVQGTTAMNFAKKASSFSPLSAKGYLGAPLVYSALHSIGSLDPMIAGGLAAVPSAIGAAARFAYPRLTAKQVDKVIATIKKGKPVPGTPTYYPMPTQGANYPPLLPPLVLQQLLNQNGGNQP